jgi:peroxiredoxin
MAENALEVGEQAPDFTLKNQRGQEVTLSSLKGKKVLLSFHPLAWTPVCEIQMRSLEAKFNDLAKVNTVPLGISVDSGPSKKKWAESLELERTDLLADFWPHGETAKKYKLFIKKAGISARANILIDEQGNIEWLRIYDIPEIPDIEEILRHLRKPKQGN